MSVGEVAQGVRQKAIRILNQIIERGEPADHAAGDHRKHCMFQPGAKWLSGRSEKRGGGERRHEKDVVDLPTDRHRNPQARKAKQTEARTKILHVHKAAKESEKT